MTDFLFSFFCSIVVAVFGLYMLVLIDMIKEYIIRLIKRRLCKHEYFIDWKICDFRGHTEYYFKCRKCGKIKQLEIYQKEDKKIVSYMNNEDI